MKKTMLLAVCLVLAGMLTVNGTFAAAFTQAVNETLSHVFRLVEGLTEPTEDAEQFDVALVYTDNTGTPLSTTVLPQLMPGYTVDRYTAVVNRSPARPAYFRVALAVQADVFELLTFHLNTDDYEWSEWMDINEGDCKMKVATYCEALEANEKSPAVLQKVTLDAETTSADLLRFRPDFLRMQVLAIDASDFSGFDSIADALDAAVPLSVNNHPFQ